MEHIESKRSSKSKLFLTSIFSVGVFSLRKDIKQKLKGSKEKTNLVYTGP